MIVVLDVKDLKFNLKLKNIKYLFKTYQINANIKTKNGISVLYIEYFKNSKKIKFNKIYMYMIGMPKTILCNDNISLKNTKLKRFNNLNFNICMMKNLLVEMLQILNENFPSLKCNISFIDLDANYTGLIEKLLPYSNQCSVITNMPKFYENEAERFMDKYGISILVSNSMNQINPYNIIISPAKIKMPIPTTSSSIIFTTAKPLVNISGTIVTKYIPKFPIQYDEIKPDCIDDFYFLSAIYEIYNKKELENLNPFLCQTDGCFLLKNQVVEKIKTLITNN